MATNLKWNRLWIESSNAKEFKGALNEHLPRLLRLPYSTLEVDLSASSSLGEAEFKQIATALLTDQNKGRRLTLRMPEEFKGFFVGSGMAGHIKGEVVRRMTDATVRRKTGRIDKSRIVEEDPQDFATIEPSDEPETGFESAQVTDGTQITMGMNAALQPRELRAGQGWLVDADSGSKHEVGEQILVGREAPSDPVFPIPTVSKRHFRIYREGNGFFIEDLRSTNGTYVNGEPLHQPTPLGEGDKIVIAITLKHPDGARRFKFTTQGP